MVADLLRLSRLTVLYGAAGAGKTTLLRGEVLRLLGRRGDDRCIGRRNGVVVPFPDRRTARERPLEIALYFDRWTDAPLIDLQTRIASALIVRRLRVAPPFPPLVDSLGAWSVQLGVRFLFIFDRFEQFAAASRAKPGIAEFDEAFVAIVNEPLLPVNVLVAVRDDAAPLLERYRTRIPGFGDASVRLPPFDRVAKRLFDHTQAVPRASSVAAIAHEVEKGAAMGPTEGSSDAPATKVDPPSHHVPVEPFDEEPTAALRVRDWTTTSPSATLQESLAVLREWLPASDVAASEAASVQARTCEAADERTSASEAADERTSASDAAPEQAFANDAASEPASASEAADQLRVASKAAGEPGLTIVTAELEVPASDPADAQLGASDEVEVHDPASDAASVESSARDAAEVKAATAQAPATEAMDVSPSVDSEIDETAPRAAAAESTATAFVDADVREPASPATPDTAARTSDQAEFGRVGAARPSRPRARSLSTLARWSTVAVVGAALAFAAKRSIEPDNALPRALPAAEQASARVETPVVASPAAEIVGPRLELAVDAGNATDRQIADDIARWVARDAGLDLRVGVAADGYTTAPRLSILSFDALRPPAGARRPAGNSEDPFAILMPLYTEEVHALVRRDSPLRYLHEMRGARINVGPRGTGSHTTAARIYARMFETPLPPAQASVLPAREALEQLVRDGSIDVVLVVEAQPVRWLADLPAELAGAVRPLAADFNDRATVRAVEDYLPTRIRRASYRWLDADVPTMSTMAFMIVDRASVEGAAQPAASLAAALCERLPALRRSGHAKWREVQPGLRIEGGWQIWPPAQSAIESCLAKGDAGVVVVNSTQSPSGGAR